MAGRWAPWLRRVLLVPLLGAWPLWPGEAQALAAMPPDQICDAAAARAAESTGVPLAVLRTITRTETGRGRGGTLQPWPWTVNAAGEGRWFDSRAEALAWARSKAEAGARNFDVGCFQINYRWHGQNFPSIDAMFDPAENALYAARFLAGLHGELGDWTAAAGAFHSRTETHASRYRARFTEIRAALPPMDTAPPVLASRAGSPALPRQNAFPLLQSGGAGALGSLVPLGGS
ncbi:lytic transglycosylase domain-containing protein [Pseudoroseicyclus tamaricis]|nr:lytic transglycosylase domain-containing protein [Pseudoroseicyclus tamaricis]